VDSTETDRGVVIGALGFTGRILEPAGGFDTKATSGNPTGYGGADPPDALKALETARTGVADVSSVARAHVHAGGHPGAELDSARRRRDPHAHRDAPDGAPAADGLDLPVDLRVRVSGYLDVDELPGAHALYLLAVEAGVDPHARGGELQDGLAGRNGLLRTSVLLSTIPLRGATRRVNDTSIAARFRSLRRGELRTGGRRVHARLLNVARLSFS
jgi:hypothetical protein